MRSGARRLATAVVMCSITVFALGACSSGTSNRADGTDEVPQELLDRLNSHCTDLEAPVLGEGTLCVDSGFRMKVDDFSFPNYGRAQAADSNVTVQTLIDLFGHAAVCMPSDETRCVVRPTTVQKLEEWNNALAGGRCEGFATLSTRFQLGIENPSQYRNGVTRVVDLRRNDGDLQSSIVYWWTTQFLREVSDRAAASRTKTPLALVDDLIQGIANRVGYTLGLYQRNRGHSVTPFAVTRRGSSFIIHVYDNNFPGARKEVEVDTGTNTWSYPDAAPDAKGNTSRWTGGTGTIELTPMSARQGPFECPFCTVSAIPSASPNVISLASRDSSAPGYLRITTRGGAVLEATPDGLANAIPGAVYSVSKGAGAGLVEVSIPGSAGDIDVEVRRASASVPAGDVVLTVQRPGAARIQLSGNLAETVAGAAGIGSPVVSLRGADTTVSTPPGRIVRVTTAAGSNLSRTTLEPGQSMTVSKVTNNTIEVAVKGSDGAVIGSVSIDASGSTDSSVVILSPDQGTKSLSATSVSVTSVSVLQREPTGDDGNTNTSTTTTVVTRPASTTTTVPTIEITQPEGKNTKPTTSVPRSTTTTVPKKKPQTPKTTTTTVAPTTSVPVTTSVPDTTTSTTMVDQGNGNNGNNGNGNGGDGNNGNGNGGDGNNGNGGDGNNGNGAGG